MDIGDPASETTHQYQIDRATWLGDRVFRSDAGEIWDDGRAFVGFQRFVVHLDTTSDVCLAKRIDAGVGGS